MSTSSSNVEMITKKELIREVSKRTHFTQANCTKAYDAIMEVIADTIADGRGVSIKSFGRLEPFTKKPRKMYYLDDKTGIKLDENGEKVSYMFPETRWVKFNMYFKMKCRMNPGIYSEEDMSDSD